MTLKKNREFLSIRETEWFVCIECGYRWPQGHWGIKPNPIFNPDKCIITEVECYKCARKNSAQGLRFG